jgi:hypothetical protein
MTSTILRPSSSGAASATLLSDPKSVVIDRYKLRDPQYRPAITPKACRPDHLHPRQERRDQSEAVRETYAKRRLRHW